MASEPKKEEEEKEAKGKGRPSISKTENEEKLKSEVTKLAQICEILLAECD